MSKRLTTAEVIKLLGVGPSTLTAMITQKRLDIEREGVRKYIIVNEKLAAAKRYTKLSQSEKLDMAKGRWKR